MTRIAMFICGALLCASASWSQAVKTDPASPTAGTTTPAPPHAGVSAFAHPLPAEQAYQKVAHEFLADLYRRNPTYATYLGLHQYDAQLEDYSRAAVDDELA